MISYEELAAENDRILGIIKVPKEENAVLRSMLPPEAELPPKPKETEPRPQPLGREAVIAQRLFLFRSLFRGREDVYAKRWVSKDGQRAGYKPVCDFLHATTAFGKTVTAVALIARRKVNTLILVPTSALLGQWKKELERFLSINFEAPEEQVGWKE